MYKIVPCFVIFPPSNLIQSVGTFLLSFNIPILSSKKDRQSPIRVVSISSATEDRNYITDLSCSPFQTITHEKRLRHWLYQQIKRWTMREIKSMTKHYLMTRHLPASATSRLGK